MCNIAMATRAYIWGGWLYRSILAIYQYPGLIHVSKEKKNYIGFLNHKVSLLIPVLKILLETLWLLCYLSLGSFCIFVSSPFVIFFVV